MLTMHQRLRPREEEVASKVIDGEAIIINLSNGIYYSMDKVGGLVWEMIGGKKSLAEMVDTITAHYDVTGAQARKDVEQLVMELLEENLVSLADDDAPSIESSELEVKEKLPFETPKLSIYRDMGDLLALDPPTPGLGDTPWKDPDEGSSR